MRGGGGRALTQVVLSVADEEQVSGLAPHLDTCVLQNDSFQLFKITLGERP